MRANLLFSLVCALLLAATPGFAQADLEATVPFDFYAGNAVLPAGVYTLDVDNAGLIWIQRDGRHALRAVVGSFGIGGGPDDGQNSKLVFHRYGDEYFLSKMWVAGRSQGRQLTRTPREDDVAQIKARGTTILAIAH